MKRPRKHFNRFVRVLAELYDMSYAVVNAYYHRFNRDVQLTKFHLNRIMVTGHELESTNWYE